MGEWVWSFVLLVLLACVLCALLLLLQDWCFFFLSFFLFFFLPQHQRRPTYTTAHISAGTHDAMHTLLQYTSASTSIPYYALYTLALRALVPSPSHSIHLSLPNSQPTSSTSVPRPSSLQLQPPVSNLQSAATAAAARGQTSLPFCHTQPSLPSPAQVFPARPRITHFPPSSRHCRCRCRCRSRSPTARHSHRGHESSRVKPSQAKSSPLVVVSSASAAKSESEMLLPAATVTGRYRCITSLAYSSAILPTAHYRVCVCVAPNWAWRRTCLRWLLRASRVVPRRACVCCRAVLACLSTLSQGLVLCTPTYCTRGCCYVGYYAGIVGMW
ncbi:uncharacterized protein K452DRAFT_165226 [Aplosporella prunicola CBS 121167]|uniref:Uncharacterized protein n=1 Tax=Aplosporella prunicola CBS 121167 TaxID=1176127 RepID=A0A6A6AUN5_9PEZI|nr:uncharacterized protein K452DRAFT_165226 [Aplosporella prunicola CBS 121167]KAF2135742.1 hypothetical protein K452DRAFT_165226 [Aplosporella prunicola CBS 121167]